MLMSSIFILQWYLFLIKDSKKESLRILSTETFRKVLFFMLRLSMFKRKNALMIFMQY